MKECFDRNIHWFVGLIAVVLMAIGLVGLKVSLVNMEKIDRNFQSAEAFKTRTIDRWDYLQKENPQLKVPEIDEPLDKARLTPQELNRKPKD